MINSLKVENALLLKIIDSSYDGIFITDAQGSILYFNEAYLKISGLDRSRIDGRNMQNLIETSEIPDACTPEVIATKMAVTKVIDYYHGVSALVTSTPVFTSNGELIRVFSNVRDVTELLKLREQLRDSKDLNNEYKRQLWQIKQQTQETQLLVNSPVMENILRLALRIAQVNSPVLLQGESGVGKDMLAHYIHEAASNAADRPFVQINCSAIPDTLLESELFGYEPGAFTGASKKGKPGLFELANNGTLFLDEIGEMPLAVQVKLLDVLQTNKVYRLGGTKTVPISTRIIAATNSDLEKAVQQNTFRRDLYYRLNVIPITIPPLRERQEDIVPLIFHFVDRKNRKFGFSKKISTRTVDLLTTYSWPGNVRELRNVVERMVVMADGDVIDEKCVPSYIKSVAGDNVFIFTPDFFESYDLKKIMDKLECEVIKKVLTECGSLRKAAASMGIDLSTLVRKKKKHGI